MEAGSMEDLAGEVAKLRTENEGLRKRLADLEAQLEQVLREGKRQAAPFRKPDDQRKPEKHHKKAGQKPGHAPSNRKPPGPDQIQSVVKVPLNCCPGCSGELTDLRQHEHFVIDLPRVIPTWTKYITESGHCQRCKQRSSSHIAEMPSSAVGAANISLGHNMMALAALLKTQAGTPFRKMQSLFKQWFQVDVSQSGLQKALGRVESALAPTHRAIEQDIKQSQAAHLDETGWRVAAESHWAWVAATSTCTLYVISKSRGQDVAKRILGESYTGCLHSDFLNTYNPLNCKKSKCISHVLAHIDKLTRHHKTEPTPARAMFLSRLRLILKDTIKLWHQRNQLAREDYDGQVQAINSRVDKLLARRPRDPDARRLRKRLLKHRADTFRCLTDPQAVPTNNLAERELRPLVIARKLSAGNRSTRSATRTALLYSVYATLKRQGKDVVESLLDALHGRKRNLLSSA